MIEGLKLTLKGSEIRDRCAERISYHEEREAFYRKSSDDFVAETERIEAVGQDTRQSTLNGFQKALKYHKARAVYFRFVKDHLEPGENYVLALEELRALEFEVTDRIPYY